MTPNFVVDTEGQLLNAFREGSEASKNVMDQFTPSIRRLRIEFFLWQEKIMVPHSKAYVLPPTCCILSVEILADSKEIVELGSAHA